MKKWLLIGGGGLVAIFAVMAVMSWVGMRANESALADIRDQAGVVVLDVSGMT